MNLYLTQTKTRSAIRRTPWTVQVYTYFDLTAFDNGAIELISRANRIRTRRERYEAEAL